MKRLIMIILLLSTGLNYAHDKTKEDKKLVYSTIKLQLDKGNIDVKTAQKMWRNYIYCCKKEKKEELK